MFKFGISVMKKQLEFSKLICYLLQAVDKITRKAGPKLERQLGGGIFIYSLSTQNNSFQID